MQRLTSTRFHDSSLQLISCDFAAKERIFGQTGTAAASWDSAEMGEGDRFVDVAGFTPSSRWGWLGGHRSGWTANPSLRTA